MQVLEILSHVNKRIKERAGIKLPLAGLLDAGLSSTSPPLVRNFGVIYAEMAFERADPAERLAAVWCCPAVPPSTHMPKVLSAV